MRSRQLALVAPADAVRTLLARYLRESRYEVVECVELAIATRFAGVVLVDEEADEAIRTRVQSWIKQPTPTRIIVITHQPGAWRTLTLAFADRLYALPAPATGWDVVKALRAAQPGLLA